MDPLPRPGRKSLLAGALTVLLVIGALGFVIVPAHWTSIWADREFTGWVAPVANRLGASARLYEPGLHSPMPPLPFVLVHALFPNGACWIDESRLNYGFQAATILLLFLAFARTWGVGIALAAALATTPVFFSLPKTILYDSLAQFLVALAGVAAVASGNQARATRWGLPALGLVLGLLTLSKQSTGAGVAVAVSLWLLLQPSAAKLHVRLLRVALCALWTVLAICAIGWLTKPWVSFPGLLHDVFLTGSEPKGGPAALLVNLGRQLGQIALTCALAGVGFFGVSYALRTRVPVFQKALSQPFQLMTPTSADEQGRRLLVLGVLVSAIGLTGAVLGADLLGPSLGADPGAPNLGLHSAILSVGLLLCLISGGALFFRWRHQSAPAPEAGYALIFGIGALFHSLSVTLFRWTYDNNPLVMLALAFVAGWCLSVTEWKGKGALVRLRSMPAALFALLILSMWPLMLRQMYFALRCSQEWPEVAYLKGARLRAESVGMRELVGTVRTLADAHRDPTVLLLPNDPNVEAWFERPRPNLSSAIVFVDQYWDRFVEGDFAELERHPPAVIVIGPSRSWREFARRYHGDWGSERLINLVQEKMLPERYTLQKQQLISFMGMGDTMDVYVRKEGP